MVTLTDQTPAPAGTPPKTGINNIAMYLMTLCSISTFVFNATYGRSGHLFQGRFGAVRIRTQAQLDAVAADLPADGDDFAPQLFAEGRQSLLGECPELRERMDLAKHRA